MTPVKVWLYTAPIKLLVNIEFDYRFFQWRVKLVYLRIQRDSKSCDDQAILYLFIYLFISIIKMFIFHNFEFQDKSVIGPATSNCFASGNIYNFIAI